MEIFKFWHLRTVFSNKIALALLFVLAAAPAFGQQSEVYNLPNYDQRFITYGFSLGGHVSSLRPKFSSAFTNPQGAFSNILNIEPGNAFGFSIKFLANFRAAQFLDIRVMPGVSFYDYTLKFETRANTDPVNDAVVDYTTFDIPLSLKFNSQRRGNHRLFLTGGVTPIIDITGKKKKEQNTESAQGLQLSGDNLTADVGFGADFYFPLFRFSPEIRYSYGLRDVLENKNNDYGQAFDRLGTHIIGVYLVFN